MKRLLVVCALVAWVASAGTAVAAPILIGTAANVTGISGLEVGSATYDVSFSPSSYNATFAVTPPTFLNDNPNAAAAAQAIASLFLAQGVVGINGFGCSAKPAGVTGFFSCVVVVPNRVSSTATVTYTHGAYAARTIDPNGGVIDWQGTAADTIQLDTSQTQGFLTGSPNYPVGWGGYNVFAVFTRAQAPPPVPEPGTMLLLGTGLAAVIAARRRRA